MMGGSPGTRMSPASPSSDRRRALAEFVRERADGKQSALPVRLIGGGLLLAALLFLLAAWLLGFFGGGPAPEVAEIRRLVDGQIEEFRRAGRNETPLVDDAPGYNAVLDRVRELPPDLRRAAEPELGRLFEARERATMDSYFALPPERRQAELDRRIRAEESRRRARDAERSREGRGQGGGTPRP